LQDSQRGTFQMYHCSAGRYGSIRRAARLKRWLALAPSLVMMGCAHPSDEIVAHPVSTTPFEGYECAEIADRTKGMATRMTELKVEVDETADDDELMTTVGILVFPPLLFFLKGDGPEAEEYSRLMGEHAALQSVYAQKGCAAANSV
jgi:hypothetical protein